MRFSDPFSFAAFAMVASALECSPSAIQSALPANASVNRVELVPAKSTFEPPEGDLGYPDKVHNLPALCAVSVQVQSIGNSTFGLGLFLPEDWNERFLAVGNSGLAGGINWLEMVCASYSAPFAKTTANI